MEQSTNAAGNKSAPLTVDDAAKAFGLLTPQEHEDGETRTPEGAGDATEADATTSTQEDRPDETAEATETADAEQTQDADLAFTVLIDGKEAKVTAEEARNGYLRQQDFTRKTQAVAEQRKQAEAELTAYREQRTQYADGLKTLRQAIEANAPPEPDWDQLRRENPNEYAIQRLAFNERKQALSAVQDEENRIAQEQALDAQRQNQERVAKEQEVLFEKIPDWKDQKKAEAELAAMREHAKQYGFSETEIAQVSDHRTVLLLRDAMRYREMQAKKPEARKRIEQVKTASPGGQKTPEPNADQKRALERLTKSGKVADAAAAFLARQK